MFLEAFKEIEPHKKATITPDALQRIRINNEYDLQHLLYAALKPLWPDARTEVVEDTGYSFVRTDIKIPSIKVTIEAKCTRKSMTVKALQEQIAADSSHYGTDYLFIFVYDREKIIHDKGNFENAYTKLLDKKQIYTIVLQPVKL